MECLASGGSTRNTAAEQYGCTRNTSRAVNSSCTGDRIDAPIPEQHKEQIEFPRRLPAREQDVQYNVLHLNTGRGTVYTKDSHKYKGDRSSGKPTRSRSDPAR